MIVYIDRYRDWPVHPSSSDISMQSV